MSTALITQTHVPSTNGQRGIWSHSQNEEEDLLKRFVVQVKVKHGWLSMRSFHTADMALEDVSYRLNRQLGSMTHQTIRIWDDNQSESLIHF